MKRKEKREAQLRSEGIDGKAKLGDWWIVGKSGGVLESIELIEYELEVFVPGKSPYNVKHRKLTPFGMFTSLTKGMLLPVKVHPDKPKQLLLDLEQALLRPQPISAADLPVEIEDIIKGMGEADGKKGLKDKLRELEEAYK